MKKYRVVSFLLFIGVLFMFSLNILADVSLAKVYVIPIESTIDLGLASFVERSYLEAEKLDVDMVILEVDTPGGRVDAALDIRETIWDSEIPTTALVKGGAISAGAFITLAAPQIAMVPGSTIGDAEPRDGDERADEKFLSYWAAEMASTADKNGRDREIAVAMADRDVVIQDVVEKGKLLTLTYKEAEELSYTDYIVKDRAELLKELNLEGAEVIEAKFSVAEKITRIVTNPYIAPFFLTIGIAGIIIEVFTVGWGVAGAVGILSLVLYFGGHLLAGFTGWGSILLFMLGLILLGVEIAVPGFGLPGFGGIVSIISSIVLAAPSWEAGIVSLVFAIVGTIILVLISFKVLTKRKLWSRLVLDTKYNKEEGYIPQIEDLSIYVGKTGKAVTILRPAGTVILDNGVRLDVVTNGDFIHKGAKVEIVRAEGIRLVVQPIDEQ
ncbi:MAG: NfeD family protein [Clostridia bacterium]|nr:NfeD family protein [Clostridia bacterium]MDD4047806.1 NfeD family protein [Clostridia bacterium]